MTTGHGTHKIEEEEESGDVLQTVVEWTCGSLSLSHPPLRAALPLGRRTERRWNVHVRAVFAPATDTAPLLDNLCTSLQSSSSLLTKGPSAPHVRVSPARAAPSTAHAQHPHRFLPRLLYQFSSICQYTTFPIETVRYVSFASFLISSVDVHLFLIYFSPFKTYSYCYYALPPGSNTAALPRSIDPGKTCRYFFVYLSYFIRGISFFSWGGIDLFCWCPEIEERNLILHFFSDDTSWCARLGCCLLSYICCEKYVRVNRDSSQLSNLSNYLPNEQNLPTE